MGVYLCPYLYLYLYIFFSITISISTSICISISVSISICMSISISVSTPEDPSTGRSFAAPLVPLSVPQPLRNRNLLLRTEVLHDLIYQNLRNNGTMVYSRSCRTSISSAAHMHSGQRMYAHTKLTEPRQDPVQIQK